MTIGATDSDEGSRVGGSPPLAIDDTLLSTHDYLLTLGVDTADWLRGRELSVFLRRGFSIADDDLVYPDIGARVVIHPPSPRATNGRGVLASIGSAALVPYVGEEALSFVRIGDEPLLIQNEPSYAKPALDDGLRFLFQLNDEGFPVDGPVGEFLDGDYLFGYGSLYFYGRVDDAGARDVVPGFLDF
ncbi:hypothetical protein [Stackebrandtia soli]|uniref:hypothetical protein n=1 Tax=Stackebrandtia soli TaxID=1892856 RepID=UPI0039E912C5